MSACVITEKTNPNDKHGQSASNIDINLISQCYTQPSMDQDEQLLWLIAGIF